MLGGMSPVKVAIFAVVVIAVGVLASFWLEQETEMEPRRPEIPKPQASKPKKEPAPAQPKLVIREAKIQPVGNTQYEVTYFIKNTGRENTPGSTVVRIYPLRYGTPMGVPTEEPVREGEYGWSTVIQDRVPMLLAGKQVERKVTFNADPRVEPARYLKGRVHFQIDGHPQE